MALASAIASLKSMYGKAIEDRWRFPVSSVLRFSTVPFSFALDISRLLPSLWRGGRIYNGSQSGHQEFFWILPNFSVAMDYRMDIIRLRWIGGKIMTRRV